MPEPFVPKDDDTSGGKQDNDVVIDVFGSDNKDPQPPKDGEDDKGKDDKGADDKNKGGKEPTLAELQQQLKEANEKIASMGGNLSGQRELIKTLESQIKDKNGSGGKKDGAEDTSHLPFDPKTIVFSKDLPKEKLEDMTGNEIKLHDELMTNREIMNKQAQERFDEKKGAESKKVDDLNSLVRDTAKTLAKGDETLANSIIESSKKFNLTGLNEEEVKQRVAEAHKLLPDYRPPKEPVTKKGGAIKEGADKDDPFGTSKIVEEVASQRNGKSFSL